MSRLRCASVCREWRTLLRDPHLWERIDFPLPLPSLDLLDLASLVGLLRRGPFGGPAGSSPVRALSFWRAEWIHAHEREASSPPPPPPGRVALLAVGRPAGGGGPPSSPARSPNGLATATPPQVPPSVLMRDLALATASLTELALDDSVCRALPFNDAFCKLVATVLAARGQAATSLRVLALSFAPYSAMANALTDDGLIAFLERAPGLQSLTLRGCTSLTDRTVLALGSLCPDLQALEVHGFSDVMHAWSFEHVFKSCRRLRSVRLDARLVKCDDLVAVSLRENLSGTLESAKLPARVTADAAAVLAFSCGRLRRLDLTSCRDLLESPTRALEMEDAIRKRAPWVTELCLPTIAYGSGCGGGKGGHSSPIERYGQVQAVVPLVL